MKSGQIKFIKGFSLVVLLLFSTSLIFNLFTKYFGQKFGYLLGFIFYWIFWCLAIPLVLIGKNAIMDLISLKHPILGKRKKVNILLLLLPLVLAYSYEFPKALRQANAVIILVSAGISILNATAEEILWRGTFLKWSGINPNWYILVSSMTFAIWHFVPLSVFPNHNPGGSFSFVAASFLIGLCYATVTKDTGSIYLTIMAHILFDFSGLGAIVYF